MKSMPEIRIAQGELNALMEEVLEYRISINSRVSRLAEALTRAGPKPGCPNCDTYKSYRERGEASARIYRLQYHPESKKIELELWPEDNPNLGGKLVLTYNGQRWRENEGWIGRDRIEEILGTGFGYCDAIEDLYKVVTGIAAERYISEQNQKLEAENQELKSQMARLKTQKMHEWRTSTIKTTEAPETLTETLSKETVAAIRQVALPEGNEAPKIYYLFQQNQLQYIGKTIQNGPGRIIQHYREKLIPFDRAYYTPCLETDLAAEEKRLIRLLKPQYNRTHK